MHMELSCFCTLCLTVLIEMCQNWSCVIIFAESGHLKCPQLTGMIACVSSPDEFLRALFYVFTLSNRLKPGLTELFYLLIIFFMIFGSLEKFPPSDLRKKDP